MIPKNTSRQHEDGGALVELALVLPVLILVFVGTVDYARVFHTSQALNNAARAGARYGSHTPARSGDIAGMQTAATTATNITGVTAVASRSCQCATSAGIFSATLPTANDCTSPEATSCPGTHRVVTVSVTTSKTFTTIMSGGLPSFMQSVNLSRTAAMRAQ